MRVELETQIWHNNDEEEGDGPWRHRGTTSSMVTGIKIARDDYGYSYRGMDTELERPFFVVYATYYTGDTFGSDWDCTIVGIVNEYDEARRLEDEARAFTGFGSLSNGFHVPWTGYFESLENISIGEVR